MTVIERLSEIFKDFPGIGPRQSKRFVYFLLTRKQDYLNEIIELLKNLRKETSMCASCYRYFPKNNSKICHVCLNQDRDKETLMVLSRDIDLENMERSGAYKGGYFVLGGSIPILEKEPERRIRLNELLLRIANEESLKEIIIAMNANPEGENTEIFIREGLAKNLNRKNVKISTLGRGLSTGVELEYSDSETLKGALENRHIV